MRPAVPADLAAVNAVAREAGRPEWPAGALTPRADRIAVVALARGGLGGTGAPGEGGPAEGTLLGYAKTHRYPTPDGAAPAGHYLGGIVVHPAARRRGVGRALTEARLAWIWERADAAYYLANARNTASIALHEGLGFRQVASGASFQAVTFDGGRGLVFEARRPASCPGR
ncbi:GNAT family N-acetyltransferase [Sinomonas soli]